MKAKDNIPVERLYDLFDVDFEKGLLFWKAPASRRMRVGDKAGWLESTGYLRVEINNDKFRVHRIIWAMKHGKWPEHYIDHINGNKIDNRIENLREATQAQNLGNISKTYRNNKTGFKGIFFRKEKNNFQAEIRDNKKRIYLGSFATAEEAHEAYKAAHRRIHGDFSPY